MGALISADLLKLRRRRGLWWTTLLLGAALAVLAGCLGAIFDSLSISGGTRFAHDGAAVVGFIAPIVSAIVGARLGADEHAQQTFRYQVLSGRSRTELYFSKVGVLVVAMTIATLIATIAIAIMSFVPPPNGADTIDPKALGVAFWQIWLPTVVYGCLALGVGALIRATGGAIALAIVLRLLGSTIVALLTLIADFFKYGVLSIALDRITSDSLKGEDYRVTIAAAIIATVAWVALFLGLGLSRTRRSED